MSLDRNQGLIPLVTCQTTLSIVDIVDCPHKPTQVFPAYFVFHLHAFRESSLNVTHLKIAPTQARLIVELIWNGLPKRYTLFV
jgi:hypothetical protein